MQQCFSQFKSASDRDERPTHRDLCTRSFEHHDRNNEE
jgi:hypothetical protein